MANPCASLRPKVPPPLALVRHSSRDMGARQISGGVPRCAIRVSRETETRSVTSSFLTRSPGNLVVPGLQDSELRSIKQSLRETRELHAVNVLNELDLAAEAVGSLGDTAEDLLAMISESAYSLNFVDLGAVMDEP